MVITNLSRGIVVTCIYCTVDSPFRYCEKDLDLEQRNNSGRHEVKLHFCCYKEDS